MELVGGSWESINSPYRKTLRVQYAEKSASREFARNYDPFSLFHRPPNFKYSRVPRYPPIFLDPLPLSSFIPLLIFLFPRLIFPLVFSLPIPHISPPLPLPLPFLISISRIPPSPLSYCLTYSPFPSPSPHLAEKMSMARQKTVLHEVTGCQTFLPRLEGSSVFRSRYVSENNTYRGRVWRTRATMFAR